MTTYLIRHGQKEKIMGDPALTELGQEQARKTSQYFSSQPGLKIDAIIASPTQRTVQTAEIIAEPLHVPIQIDSYLIERANWGDNPLLTFDQFMTQWRQGSNDRDYAAPGGSSSRAAGQRLETVLEKVAGHPWQHVILVSHGGIITDWLRTVLGDEYLIEHYFKNYQNLRDTVVPECSITQVELLPDKVTVEKLYTIDHLK